MLDDAFRLFFLTYARYPSHFILITQVQMPKLTSQAMHAASTSACSKKETSAAFSLSIHFYVLLLALSVSVNLRSLWPLHDERSRGGSQEPGK